jgi:hypothetical protein
MRGPKNQI